MAVRPRTGPWADRGSRADALAGADAQTAHAQRHRRAWAFEVAVVVLTVASGVLTLLALIIPYFAVDLAVEQAIQSPRAAWLDALANAVSWVGFPPQSNVVFGAIIFTLFVTGQRWQAAGTLFAAAGSAGLWFLVAPLVHRARPDPSLVRVAMQIPYGSFPSGHVLNFTATFGFLAFLAWHARRPILTVLCLLPPIAIALSRLYLGEHWPSDVLGGFLFGGLWLALTIRLYRWLSHGRRLRRLNVDAE
jgi:membrane-associated phospholipid phosphatase